MSLDFSSLWLHIPGEACLIGSYSESRDKQNVAAYIKSPWSRSLLQIHLGIVFIKLSIMCPHSGAQHYLLTSLHQQCTAVSSSFAGQHISPGSHAPRVLNQSWKQPTFLILCLQLDLTDDKASVPKAGRRIS